MSENYTLITPEEAEKLHADRPDLSHDLIESGLFVLDLLSIPEKVGFSLCECFILMNESEESLEKGLRLSDLSEDQRRVSTCLSDAIKRLSQYVSKVTK